MRGSHGLDRIVDGRTLLVDAANGSPERIKNRIKRRKYTTNVLEVMLDEQRLYIIR